MEILCFRSLEHYSIIYFNLLYIFRICYYYAESALHWKTEGSVFVEQWINNEHLNKIME